MALEKRGGGGIEAKLKYATSDKDFTERFSILDL